MICVMYIDSETMACLGQHLYLSMMHVPWGSSEGGQGTGAAVNPCVCAPVFLFPAFVFPSFLLVRFSTK